MRKRVTDKYIEDHPELQGMDEEELKGALYEISTQIASEKEATRKARLREHLEVFSDAIIAIIITIMVLEIPLPIKGEGGSYTEFIQAIGMFLVSFFLVGSFWLDHHRSFDDVEVISDKVLIADFVFMASLSIMPIMTKWIMVDIHTFAVVNFGIVYLVVNLLEGVLLAFIADEKYKDEPDMRKMYGKFIGLRQLMTVLIDGVLIGLAFVSPLIAMIWFLAIPIISFIMSGRDTKKRAEVSRKRMLGKKASNTEKSEDHEDPEEVMEEIDGLL
jgi:uncharacterized membrane protein